MVSQITKERQERITKTIRQWGYEPHFFSVATGVGLGEVAALLSNRTTVIAGMLMYLRLNDLALPCVSVKNNNYCIRIHVVVLGPLF